MSAAPSTIEAMVKPPTSGEAATAVRRATDGGRRTDVWMIGGILLTFAALAAGIRVTGIPASYFLQPSGVLIVIGGTLGATLVTTPKRALLHAAQTAAGLWSERADRRIELANEIMSYVRAARTKGLLGLESSIRNCRHEFLRECLTLALDVEKGELQATIRTKSQLRERQADADARTLEIAGGFAPTIGVLGTVIGLIDALRRFSDLGAAAGGVGMAFTSTLYGLGLANLLLLPLAHRIRAAAAASLETEEMVIEGIACILDGVHPTLAQERLKAFSEEKPAEASQPS